MPSPHRAIRNAPRSQVQRMTSAPTPCPLRPSPAPDDSESQVIAAAGALENVPSHSTMEQLGKLRSDTGSYWQNQGSPLPRKIGSPDPLTPTDHPCCLSGHQGTRGALRSHIGPWQVQAHKKRGRKKEERDRGDGADGACEPWWVGPGSAAPSAPLSLRSRISPLFDELLGIPEWDPARNAGLSLPWV